MKVSVIHDSSVQVKELDVVWVKTPDFLYFNCFSNRYMKCKYECQYTFGI